MTATSVVAPEAVRLAKLGVTALVSRERPSDAVIAEMVELAHSVDPLVLAAVRTIWLSGHSHLLCRAAHRAIDVRLTPWIIAAPIERVALMRDELPALRAEIIAALSTELAQ